MAAETDKQIAARLPKAIVGSFGYKHVVTPLLEITFRARSPVGCKNPTIQKTFSKPSHHFAIYLKNCRYCCTNSPLVTKLLGSSIKKHRPQVGYPPTLLLQLLMYNFSYGSTINHMENNIENTPFSPRQMTIKKHNIHAPKQQKLASS